MRRLSSADIWMLKRIAPVICFGLSGVMFVVVLVGVFENGRNTSFLLVTLALAAVWFVIMKLFVWVLMDEVWDDNGWLVVRNSGREARIDLLDIININHSLCSRPEIVTLTLREPCVFGRSIQFSPPYRFFTLGKSPVVTELAELIVSKRRMAAASGGA